jgi:hypothetical protein
MKNKGGHTYHMIKKTKIRHFLFFSKKFMGRSRFGFYIKLKIF